MEQAVQCLEVELGRPDSEKKKVNTDDSHLDSSVSATPVLMVAGGKGEELSLDKLDFSGPAHVDAMDTSADETKLTGPSAYPTEAMQRPLSHVAEATENVESSSDDAEGELTSSSSTPVDSIPSSSTTSGLGSSAGEKKKTKKTRFKGVKRGKKAKQGSGMSEDSSQSDDSVERVINVKNCPLCHRPRLNSKAEMDIVTHLAVCASGDWNKVDQIVVGNFVTASQAQRKWYTKIISKVSSGDYKLGAVRVLSFYPVIILSKVKPHLEFGQYNRPESHVRSARGRKNASIRPPRYSATVQRRNQSYGGWSR